MYTAEQDAKTQELLMKGNELGKAASAVTGVPYTPIMPTTPPAMSADSVSSPTPPLTMPQGGPTTPPDYYSKILAAVPTAESIVAQKSPEEIAAEGTRKTVSDRILGVLNKFSGKTAAKQAAEDKAGLPDMQKNLTDVTSQILALQNEFKAIPLDIQNESEGRGRTAAGVAPIEAGRLRTNTVKALGLSSIAATLQGNVALAQQTVDRALAAEFDPLQTELDYLKQLYSFNQDTLSGADKEQADRINAKLLDRQEKLDAAKADKKTVLDNVLKAAAAGAPAAIVSQAIGMDLAAATNLLAPYLKDESWSAPYMLGGDYVQKNSKTGEIRTAVNVPTGDGPGNGYKFTQGQTSQLLAGGFTTGEIANLQADIATHGIDKTVEGLPSGQQDLIRRALAGSESVSVIAKPQDQYLTRENIQSNIQINDKELQAYAERKGLRHWYTTWGSEKNAVYDELWKTIQSYRSLGSTDAEIAASLPLIIDQL